MPIYNFIINHRDDLGIQDISRYDEAIEQAQTLVNALLAPNNKISLLDSDDKCCIDRRDMDIRVASTTNYTFKVSKYTAEKFAKYFCEVDENNELVKNDDGQYILNKEKFDNIVLRHDMYKLHSSDLQEFATEVIDELNAIMLDTDYDMISDPLGLLKIDEKCLSNDERAHAFIKKANLNDQQMGEWIQGKDNYLSQIKQDIMNQTIDTSDNLSHVARVTQEKSEGSSKLR